MELEDFQDDALEFDDDLDGDEADEWDEETLGLDWNEADAQRVVQDVIPSRWTD
jgi:hypothetical protein